MQAVFDNVNTINTCAFFLLKTPRYKHCTIQGRDILDKTFTNGQKLLKSQWREDRRRRRLFLQGVEPLLSAIYEYCKHRQTSRTCLPGCSHRSPQTRLYLWLVSSTRPGEAPAQPSRSCFHRSRPSAETFQINTRSWVHSLHLSSV